MKTQQALRVGPTITESWVSSTKAAIALTLLAAFLQALRPAWMMTSSKLGIALVIVDITPGVDENELDQCADEKVL